MLFPYQSSDEIAAEFEYGTYDSHTGQWHLPATIEVIIALRESDLCQGSAFILFACDGQLFEVNAAHCSCCGYEGQWQPQPTSAADLR